MHQLSTGDSDDSNAMEYFFSSDARLVYNHLLISFNSPDLKRNSKIIVDYN